MQTIGLQLSHLSEWWLSEWCLPPGRGSSATVLISLAAGDQEVDPTQVHSIAAWRRKLRRSLWRWSKQSTISHGAAGRKNTWKKDWGKIVYTNRLQDHYRLHTTKISSALLPYNSVSHQAGLKGTTWINVKPVITWIPGHSGISRNENADVMAKLALQKLPSRTRRFITFTTCKSSILKQVMAAWQQWWDRSAIGRITHEMIPIVSKRIVFPKNRCIAISYIRLLVNDSTLRSHQHPMGLADAKVWECNQTVEDEYHFFLWMRSIQ